MRVQLLILIGVFSLLACENPIKKMVRQVEYSGYEMLGVQKRDLLKRDIAATQANEREAAESFKTSLDKLRELYAMPESQLARQYQTIHSAFEDSDRKARSVRESREKMERVAKDLFNEWKGEIAQMQSTELKSSSKSKLNDSQTRFEKLDRSLTLAERKIQPVLVRLKDHELYLKHNLNAESLSQLKKEHDRIDGDIHSLIQDMTLSIAQADEYIRSIQ